MATANLTLPNGAKLRTQTQRRYIVVSSRHGEVTIVKRSDTLATVQAEYARHVDTVRSGDGTRTRWYVVDTVTGETLSKRSENEFQYVT